MKYLLKPKPKSLVIFFIVIAVCLMCNILFLIDDRNNIFKSNDSLLNLHVFLAISSITLVSFIFSYVILCIENAVSFLNIKKQKSVFSALRNVDILLGIGMFFLSGYIILHIEQFIVNHAEQISSTVYFRVLQTPNLGSDNIISEIYALWELSAYCIPTVFSVLLFISFARKNKKLRALQQVFREHENEERINASLGFDYKSCEFYKQTQIPYMQLKQEDGTWGEFLAYCMLVKGGLTDAEYVFNREIPKSDGLVTESDLIVIHKNGIIVIENKHYTTRIYGKATDHDLTIIDHMGRKISTYNPIFQNERHVAALAEYLKTKGLYVDDSITPIHSIVVFTADSNDRSDDIISGIDVTGSKTKVCTSQNLYIVGRELLFSNSTNADVNVGRIKENLLSLSIRKKSVDPGPPIYRNRYYSGRRR